MQHDHMTEAFTTNAWERQIQNRRSPEVNYGRFATCKRYEKSRIRACGRPARRCGIARRLRPLALILAAVGVYGALSYSLSLQTKAIGIRMSLMWLVIGQGMTLALVGLGLGLIAAFVLARVLSSLLFGVSAHDPLTVTLVPLSLLAVSVLACYIPARRAIGVDPIIALRYE